MPVTQIVKVDGRDVATYANALQSASSTLVFFGGTPNSGLLRPNDALACELGVRLITLDRPGYGQSAAGPSRSWRGVGDHAVQVLDALGVERCRVVGWSAGAGHAWHAASALGERCEGLAIINGLCSVDDDRFSDAIAADSAARVQMLRKVPTSVRRWMIRWTLSPTAQRFAGNPEARLSAIVDRASEPDQELLADEDRAAMLTRDAAEAFAQGVNGWLADAELMTRAWADLDESVPVAVMHAADDTEVRVVSGEAISERAGVDIDIVDGGHYWILDHWADVIGPW